MISKKCFVSTMERLSQLDSAMDEVDTAMKKLNDDFCSFYITNIFDIAIDLLEEACNDKDQWISYFAYERDWLRLYQLGDVVINDKPIEIKNWEDVYNFLMEVYK